MPGILHASVPCSLREHILKKAHTKKYYFDGDFVECKVYKTLREKCWCSGMQAEVRTHCHTCLVCATWKEPRHGTSPQLKPIPVGGPVHCVGIHVLEVVLTFDGMSML